MSNNIQIDAIKLYMYAFQAVGQAGKNCSVTSCGKENALIKIVNRPSDSQTVRAARKQLFAACHKNTYKIRRRRIYHASPLAQCGEFEPCRALARSLSLCVCAQRKQKQTIKSAAKWPFEREIRAKTKQAAKRERALRSQRVRVCVCVSK